MAARDENFLDGGTVDPFTGLAPALTPEEEATQRLLKLRYSAQQTSGNNVGFQRSQQHADNSPVTPEERAAYDAYAKEHHLGDHAYSLGHNLVRDPVTMGILAAPAAITGLGAAVGGGAALGFGLGEGSMVGAPAITTGGASIAPSLAAPSAAAGTPFSMASPFPAAGGAGGSAAASGGGGAAGFWSSVGKPALGFAAPLAIDQLTKGKTKEQKQLIEQQKKMALEAQQRQGQLQDQRMNQLGQQMLAFNPRNQMLADMFGPQAAFQPEQVAQMVQGQEPPRPSDAVMSYTGNNQDILKQRAEYIRRHNEWLQAEGQRRDMVMGGFQAPGPGPAPISMPAPQAARRF